jgi:hypothetical protein
VAWAFIAATVYLNVAAAHGNLTAAVMHAAMPVLFITVVEGVRHLIRQVTGLAGGTRIERIPVARWLLAPWPTASLARRMILWHVTSYRAGLDLERERLLAVSRLQQQYGRWQWHWRAPLADRLALRLAIPVTVASASAAGELEPAAARADQHHGRPEPAESPHGADLLSDRDLCLVDAAVAILREADERRIRLSQAALARRLREQGLTVPNQRLSWLAATARAQASAALNPADIADVTACTG